MREIELKFAVHSSFSVPQFDAETSGVAAVDELSELDLRAVYHDTSDLRLARNGATLRFRSGEGPKGHWTVKLPVERDGNRTSREELDFEGSPHRIPDQAAALVTSFARTEELVRVATIRTRRKRVRLLDSGLEEVAVVFEDEVSVLDGQRVLARFRELELESNQKRKVLQPIVEALQSAGAVSYEPIPKAVRALGPRATAPPDLVDGRGPAPDSPVGEAIGSAVTDHVLLLLGHDPWTCLGDVEGVHQMRVACRRLRSDLRTFAPLLNGTEEKFLPDLKWVAGVLGTVRDLDVMIERIERTAEGVGPELDPLIGALKARRLGSRQELLRTLNSDRYKRLLEDLVALAKDVPVSDKARREVAEVLPLLVRKPFRKLRKRAERLDVRSPDEELHKVRIAAKRARYAAEAVASSLGGKDAKQAKRFARAAADLQDLLGIVQDAKVAQEEIVAAAEGRSDDASFQFAAGRLLEVQRRDAEEARTQVPQAWARLTRKKTTKWLRS